VDDHEAVAGLGVGRVAVVARVQQRLVGLEAVFGAAVAMQGGQSGAAFAQRGERGLVFGIGQQQPGRGVGHRVRHLLRAQAPVHRDHDRAQPRGGSVKVQVLGAVLRHHRHPVAARHPCARQAGGQPARARGVLRVAVRRAVEHEGSAGAGPARIALDDAPEGEVADAHGLSSCRVVPCGPIAAARLASRRG
jgi:hypothetical protein